MDGGDRHGRLKGLELEITRAVGTIGSCEVKLAAREFDDGGIDSAVRVGGDSEEFELMVGP